jgi:hypothetical protein
MVTFDKSLIAPCGMNCGTCLAYLRPKNKCEGCRIESRDKPKTRVKCVVKNCKFLSETTTNYCGECLNFPCGRIKQLDKRYRTKYRTSFIENLRIIQTNGIDSFLQLESDRRTCPGCGSVICVHRENCLVCDMNLKDYSL